MRRFFLVFAAILAGGFLTANQSEAGGVHIAVGVGGPVYYGPGNYPGYFYGPGYYAPGYYWGPSGYIYYRHPYWHRRYWRRRHWYYY